MAIIRNEMEQEALTSAPMSRAVNGVESPRAHCRCSLACDGAV